MSKSDPRVVTHLDSAAKYKRKRENKRVSFVKERVRTLEFKNQIVKTAQCSRLTMKTEHSISKRSRATFFNENLFVSLKKFCTNFQAKENIK